MLDFEQQKQKHVYENQFLRGKPEEACKRIFGFMITEDIIFYHFILTTVGGYQSKNLMHV